MTIVLGVILLLLFLYDQLTNRTTISRRTKDQAPDSKFTIEPAGKFSSKGRAYGVDVIFVHGLGANPDTTWGRKRPRNPEFPILQNTKGGSPQSCWVTDFLPEDIPKQYHKNIRMWFYNYDSYPERDAPLERMEHYAAKLLYRIGLEVRKSPQVFVHAVAPFK
jgi:hypothetical protein